MSLDGNTLIDVCQVYGERYSICLEGGSSERFAKEEANKDLLEYCKLHKLDFNKSQKEAKIHLGLI